jgi:putative photosynthetic complex assembly protein
MSMFAPAEMQAMARRDREMIPRVLLRAMAALVLSCLALVTYARLTDRPLEALPPDGPVAVERVIHIDAGTDGAATIFAQDGTLIADLGTSEGGFIAGVWRAVQHERGKVDADPNAPVRLIRFEAGGLALRDDLTGWRAELIGFGADNAAAFARLLEE